MENNFAHIVLNRKPAFHDHRDYTLREYITPAMRRRAAQITQMDWVVERILDQGSTPHCVGFAWAGFGISLPVFDDWGNDIGDKIYYQAKIEDGEPGQENGSDTRSGAKAFMKFSKFEGSSYVFATSLDDIIIWLLTKGPVITGTNWYDSMFYPDPSGMVRIVGGVAGGHEWMISGVDTIARVFHCTNSWGEAFGIKGQFYINFDDYLRLFNEQGDAVTAAELVPEPIPTPTPPAPAPTPAPGCMPLGKLGLWLYRKFYK